MPEARLQRTRQAYCPHAGLSDCFHFYRCQSCGIELPKSYMSDWLADRLSEMVQRASQA